TLQKLQEDFSAELATLRGRVDSVEVRTAELEANRFSTTTKLNGEVVMAIASVISGKTVNGQKVNQNTVLGDRVRLNLDTSFTGQDLLRTRLQATNLDPFSQTATFTPEGDLRFAGGNNNNAVVIDA
ncbi:MAG: iron uptake porin, partial [Nostoc sp.]